MTTLISKTTPLFCHEWQMVRVSSRRLICTRRVSISVIIILGSSSIIITILILNLRSLWSRWKRSLKNEATHDRLPSCNTADKDCHLIQLSKECIKVSIHALKLRHDVPESHIARRRGGSGFGWSRLGWSRMSGRSCWPRLPWPKLHLTPFNGSNVYGTHVGKVLEHWKGNIKVV